MLECVGLLPVGLDFGSCSDAPKEMCYATPPPRMPQLRATKVMKIRSRCAGGKLSELPTWQVYKYEQGPSEHQSYPGHTTVNNPNILGGLS